MEIAEDHTRNRPKSWVDYLQRVLMRAPVPWWLPLVGIVLALITLEVILLNTAEGGTLRNPAPVAVMTLYAALVPYLFGLLFFLDRSASVAIERLRPVIRESSDWRVLRAKISNMPFWPALFSTLVGLLFFILVRIFAGVPGDPILSGTTETTRWIRLFEGVLLWPLTSVSIYHAIRQLGIIDKIYTHHVEISLLNQSPLYGLARVSSYTSIGLIIPTSLVLLAVTGLTRDPLSLGVAISVTGLSLFIFLAPLYKLHLVLDTEKDRRLFVNSQSIEGQVQKLHSQGDSFTYEYIDQIHRAIETFNLERDIIHSSPTWPWAPGSIKGTTAALLLPTVIWIIQQVLHSVFP